MAANERAFYEQQLWDVIVIGTGIGGSTLGYALARAGRRVLFCEKGVCPTDRTPMLRGTYPELGAARTTAQLADALRLGGRFSERIEDRSASRSRNFVPILGSGGGGSSALYGMAMERFVPEDFEPRRHAEAAEETTAPERWPVSYAELDPYYTAAERLYRVRGERDPLRADAARLPALRPAPALSGAASELAESLRHKGLHPYRLPLACEWVPGCRTCQGYLCDRECKNDGFRTCVAPALSRFGASLIEECEVTRLEASGTEVTSVVCRQGGETVRLRGAVVVLAAGALATPSILLRSPSSEWPSGLANRSGLVGRNLMRHFTDLYVVSPQSPVAEARYLKELAFNDCYLHQGVKLGTVQSFGELPPAPLMLRSLEDDLRAGTVPLAAGLLRMAAPVLLPALARKFARGMVLATIAEDPPCVENRVDPGDGEAAYAMHYRIRARDRDRIRRFRELMRDALAPYRFTRLNLAENNRMLGHACGTCRFGTEPEASVLDETNRAHGIANLYVVDSSFFPSSGGTNPSLTIAANALRVAARITGVPVAEWSYE